MAAILSRPQFVGGKSNFFDLHSSPTSCQLSDTVTSGNRINLGKITACQLDDSNSVI